MHPVNTIDMFFDNLYSRKTIISMRTEIVFFLEFLVKLQRAYDGWLGVKRR